MEIIPAIDLLNGACVRLYQGDYNRITHFSEDPVTQALHWQNQGAKRLHLVDLDGSKRGQPTNSVVVQAIVAALEIPVQLGGGLRSLEHAEKLLDCGLDRIILGTVAVERPDLVDALAKHHPGAVVVSIDAKNGKVATRGWFEQSDILATDLVRRFSGSGIAAIITTDIATDGTLAGPNIQYLRQIAEVSNIPVIVSGGIGCMADLLALLPLEALGVGGVIVGRALYDGRVDLAEAISAISEDRLQDITGNSSNLA
ncbi:1-(5-phosphoribosyl)-5-[(5-phosphoribosylamino)methylideneamino]imidazole-4-carboxamide isomerase [Synechococcus sp. M16CYN]|uniref:1-(5-phosphoribosyl)-5-[(5- phosphoribosylamino)methylideneamino]imidazole-4- carboxamide isomerase n=1 Tax=Synechococcus sp. M16CYN TaxID=3103139 RepID=UPI00325007AD